MVTWVPWAHEEAGALMGFFLHLYPMTRSCPAVLASHSMAQVSDSDWVGHGVVKESEELMV